MARTCAAALLLAVAACSLLATAQGREITDVPFNFTQAQASAAVNAVVAKPELVTNWLKQVKLPNYMQLQKWVSAFPPASAAVPPPQQAPPQQQGQGPPNQQQGPPNQQQGPPNQQQGPPNQQQPAVQSFAAQQPGQPQDAQPQPAQAEQGPPQPQAQPQAQAEQGPPRPQQASPRDAGPQGPPGTVPDAAAATSAQP